MGFEFATANRIIFGNETLSELPAVALEFGNCVLVVHGSGGANPERLLDLLAKPGLTRKTFQFQGEPTVEEVRRGVQFARDTDCNLVIGYGGGSALDMAKAIAGLVPNTGDVLDYLEVIGRGQPLSKPALPVIAIPTTAGTGAEVTRNAVIASHGHQFKASLRSPMLLPKLALVDPELTYGLPPEVTASTGMDALTQLIEPYVSSKSNPMTDGFCLQGIPRAAQALRRAYQVPNDKVAREDMSLASLFGGLALANSGLGGAHGFAAPIGGIYGAPHGEICARMLVPVTRANIAALRKRDPQSNRLERYRQVAVLLTGNPKASPDEAIDWLETLCRDLSIPHLQDMGVKQEDFPNLVEKAQKASSMKGNPIQLTVQELEEILKEAF